MVFIIIIAIIWILYMILTKDQRDEKKEQKRQALEQKKQNMLSDPTIAYMAETIVSILTNLKDGPVKVLRSGGSYYVLFNKGSVYYETRWKERVGDSYEIRRNTQCLLDRIDMGKNPLDDEENRIFKEIVYDKLNQIPWLSVLNYSELSVSKAKNATIPEAF